MAHETGFSWSTPQIRYAQCWEDADVLLQALEIRPGDTCLSIASGGDNTLAMLSCAPAKVIAVDLNPAQLACLELKAAAFRCLDHQGMLELVGSLPSGRRPELLRRCLGLLSPEARSFWEDPARDIRRGILELGRLESYVAFLRRWILPLIHPPDRIQELFRPKTQDERRSFHDASWNNRRWRLLFRLFFSKRLFGRYGRDLRLFEQAEAGALESLLDRVRDGLVVQDPAANPYLRWALTGAHDGCLPHALRPESFEPIRANLDRLEYRRASLDDFLASSSDVIDRFNLSDVFEYLPPDRYHELLSRLARAGRPGSRLAYWNFLVPRRRPESLAHLLRSMPELSARLHREDRTFLNGGMVVEEVI